MRTTKKWLTHLLLMVALLVTIPTVALGQPPDDPQQGQQLPESWEDLNGGPTPPIETPPPSTPACQPEQTAQQPQPDPEPTPAPVSGANYSDGHADRQAQAWRDHHSTGPAYYSQPAQQIVKQYIQNGLDPDTVFSRYEDRFIRPIVMKRKNGKLVPEEPPVRNNKDRRISRKLVYDLAINRNFVRWVIIGKQKDGLPIYQARFRQEKKDEIVAWIVTESSADLVTSLQITLRNFIVDEFEPLKAQVTKNTEAIEGHEQRLTQLEANVEALQQASGTPPVDLTPEPVASETPVPEATKTPSPEDSLTPEASETTLAPTAKETPVPSETSSVFEGVLPTPTPTTGPLVDSTTPQEGSWIDYWWIIAGLLVLGLGGVLLWARYYKNEMVKIAGPYGPPKDPD